MNPRVASALAAPGRDLADEFVLVDARAGDDVIAEPAESADQVASDAAMALVNAHQVKTHLFQLLQEVEQGEEVVIARAGVPVAQLVAWRAPTQPLATPGAMRGQIELADDFDAPLDELYDAPT
jgi:prevent-host-death family protein